MCRLKFSHDIGESRGKLELRSSERSVEKQMQRGSMYSYRKCLSESGRTAPRSRYICSEFRAGWTNSNTAKNPLQRHTRPSCYCNAIQSHVTTRLVVWLHNPICQAIGHRRAAVRVIPAGRCRRFLAAAVRVGSRALEIRRFSGSWHRLRSRGRPDVAPVGYGRPAKWRTSCPRRRSTKRRY